MEVLEEHGPPAAQEWHSMFMKRGEPKEACLEERLKELKLFNLRH